MSSRVQRKCDSCGVMGKYCAKGLCGTCYTRSRLAATPGLKEQYRKNGKNRSLQRNYGITLDDYDRMYAAQGGRCEICSETDVGSATFGHFVVDHDHKTGNIRALLCNGCNLALGHLKDDPTRVASALAYLLRFKNE